MLDALRSFGESSTMKDLLGEFVPSFLKPKHDEWNGYCRHLANGSEDSTLGHRKIKPA